MFKYVLGYLWKKYLHGSSPYFRWKKIKSVLRQSFTFCLPVLSAPFLPCASLSFLIFSFLPLLPVPFPTSVVSPAHICLPVVLYHHVCLGLLLVLSHSPASWCTSQSIPSFPLSFCMLSKPSTSVLSLVVSTRTAESLSSKTPCPIFCFSTFHLTFSS